MKLQKVEPDWFRIGQAVERAATLAAPIFEANQWKWAGTSIPDKDDIADSLRRKIKNLYHSGYEWCRSGRFCIRRERFDGYEDIRIELELAEDEVAELQVHPEDLDRLTREMQRRAVRHVIARALTQEQQGESVCTWQVADEVLAAMADAEKD